MFHPSTISIGVPMQGTPNSCRAKRNRNPYKKGFSLRLVWCTNYIPFCHFRILFLWYLSPGSLSVPKVHMVGLILMTLKLYYINRLQGTIFLNVLSECGSLRIPIFIPWETIGYPKRQGIKPIALTLNFYDISRPTKNNFVKNTYTEFCL
jgi:hypothetical protein